MNLQHLDSNEAVHGGIDWDELRRQGIAPDTVLDLSSNLLRVDHPKAVQQAIESAAISPYPDRNSSVLRTAIAERHDVAQERVLVGNGCCELIHLLAAHGVGAQRDGADAPTTQSVILGPTFSEYERASCLAGLQSTVILADQADGFAVPTETVEMELRRKAYRVIWICNPNNPTGQAIGADVIRQWIAKFPRTTFIIDESYIEFSEATESLIHDTFENLVVLRSLTKSHSMAGLRLGYLVASAARVRSISACRVPWSVNAIAQAAGAAALAAQQHYDHAMLRMREQRGRLIDELTRRGFQPLVTDTGFFLMPVENAGVFRNRLLRQGVLVRDCHSFGLSNYVRIAVGDAAATDRFLTALDTPSLSTSHRSSDLTLRGKIDDSDDFEGDSFRTQLYELFRMRRDVRRFSSDAIPPELLARWIDAAVLAPSVGLSEPWRFVSVRDAETRRHIVREFESQNATAAAGYEGVARENYLSLKLAGLREAPEQLAVFVEPDPHQGRGLGRRTMPETVAYSVVAAIQNFWLAARCDGVGVGWVSIVRPEQIGRLLNVPPQWELIAYLCVGYPLHPDRTIPELQLRNWEERRDVSEHWITR
ncbi:5,6-dimethylbenzimidazole synthase [Allorhodopirellula heiligendammensis]|uniref:Aminotransferase n=1 Tax=Allorhodopirellula heiligendammensis TaxID=2714739 RepID=A0A5C6BSS6_9BACT|nr:5,6-dimethylbenzimidazole synthase [Allorhodopirellula heiligendammensis]TWU15293.1 5,6-dimethylbenzimidazole synthase [Allorhodopirellula heiligendammensis]